MSTLKKKKRHFHDFSIQCLLSECFQSESNHPVNEWVKVFRNNDNVRIPWADPRVGVMEMHTDMVAQPVS